MSNKETKTPKAPKTPKVKVEVKPSTELNPVLESLTQVGVSVDKTESTFLAVMNKLPKGTLTEKAIASFVKRIHRISNVTGVVAKHIEKKAKSLGRTIAQAETKQARNAAKAARAQATIDRNQARLDKLNALAGTPVKK